MEVLGQPYSAVSTLSSPLVPAMEASDKEDEALGSISENMFISEETPTTGAAFTSAVHNMTSPTNQMSHNAIILECLPQSTDYMFADSTHNPVLEEL